MTPSGHIHLPEYVGRAQVMLHSRRSRDQSEVRTMGGPSRVGSTFAHAALSNPPRPPGGAGFELLVEDGVGQRRHRGRTDDDDRQRGFPGQRHDGEQRAERPVIER
jgi:hypothetical protein